MNDEVKIFTTFANKRIELVFNESFLCPTRDIGTVELHLGKSIFNWKLQMIFDKSESDKPFSTKWEYNIDGYQIRLTLFNWVSTSWIELQTPMSVKSQDNVFYFKIRTDGNPALENARKIHLSIWKEI